MLVASCGLYHRRRRRSLYWKVIRSGCYLQDLPVIWFCLMQWHTIERRFCSSSHLLRRIRRNWYNNFIIHSMRVCVPRGRSYIYHDNLRKTEQKREEEWKEEEAWLGVCSSIFMSFHSYSHTLRAYSISFFPSRLIWEAKSFPSFLSHSGNCMIACMCLCVC